VQQQAAGHTNYKGCIISTILRPWRPRVSMRLQQETMCVFSLHGRGGRCVSRTRCGMHRPTRGDKEQTFFEQAPARRHEPCDLEPTAAQKRPLLILTAGVLCISSAQLLCPRLHAITSNVLTLGKGAMLKLQNIFKRSAHNFKLLTCPITALVASLTCAT
jgi:hypothetical protein